MKVVKTKKNEVERSSIIVRLDHDTRERLQKLADAQEVSVNKLISAIVEAALDSKDLIVNL